MTLVLAGELSQDGSRIVLIAAGEPWETRQAAARLTAITPLLTPVLDARGAPDTAVTIPATWPAVVQLGHSFTGNGAGSWVMLPRLEAWWARQAAARVVPPPPLATIWPGGLQPYPYQSEDAARFAAAGKALLLHEPGTGKTVITLLGLEARRLAGHEIFPLVIVVPSWDVADVWDTHIRTWLPHWPAPVLHKGPDRNEGRDVRSFRRVAGTLAAPLITTYATARLDAAPDANGPLEQIRAAAVVADEVHLCANADAAQSRAVKRIASHAATFAGLSGTLITHDFGDVYQVLAIMDGDSWPSKKRYRARFLLTRSNGYAETVTGLRPEMEQEFFACLEGQLIRRAKADVLDWLPPKIYSVRRPDMPPQWRHAYDTMEAQMLAELPDGGDLPVMNVLTQLTRLSQLASSAADVEITWEVDEDTGLEVPRYHVTLKRPCWKAETLLGILAERPGQPTAVFTESRQLALLAGEYCTGAGLRTGYVTGTGGGITTRTRQQAVADFQAGVLDVIMCTAGAGGTGITLTAANCGVMMQRPYKYDLAVQPEDRQHRPGSEIHDHVEIIDLVTKDTVDQRRRDVLRDKAGQLGQLLRDVRVVKALLGGLD